MTSLRNDEKLSKVLELFLLPNYNIVSTSYVDILLTHISENIKEGEATDYEQCELFQTWVPKALNVWSSDCKPSQSISIFTLKLVGIIASNELRFLHWKCQDVYNRLCQILQLRKDDVPASIKMAYTTMLSSLIKHRSGRQWIIKSGVWKDMVNYAHWNHTMYVTRDSQKFVWQLLLHEQQNINFCKEVISMVAAPLMINNSMSWLHHVLEDHYSDQNKLLCTTLDLLTSIIENTMFVNMDNMIPELCQEVIDLEKRVKALYEACISTKFLQHIHKLYLLCIFTPIKGALREKKEVISADVSQNFCTSLCYISVILIARKYLIELVKTNKIIMIYWKRLQSLSEFVLSYEHKFEHQIIVTMILPLGVCIKHAYVNHDIFDMYLTKIFDVTCTAIQRLAYSVRDVMYKNDVPLEQICKASIDIILEIIDILDRDTAVITFQTLCHALRSYIPDPNNEDTVCSGTNNRTKPENSKKQVFKSLLEGNPIVEHPILLASLLNGLAVITEKFKLKWQECVETICLLSLAQDILNHPGTLPTICVKALKVCKLAIQNFMAPNLVLLTETDSQMNEIGATFFKRLHDTNWEVRDSVLEVLNTIATVAEDMYPAYQEFLLVNQFLHVAVEIAKTDSESYVRASALAFISTTVRISKLWEKKLLELNLPVTAIEILDNESEAIVRKEAAVLIKELYVHRKWSKDIVDLMSRAMSMAAAFDLHWEVKIAALQYWKQFIKSHLSDQGVLDGHFPKVTFSKEHRKIVSLDEMEIKRRLNKALDELAVQNCLGVLLVTLQDDSDLEVCKASACIINKLKRFLLKYKLNEPLPEVPLPKDSAIMDTSYIKYETQHSVSSSNSDGTFSNSSNVIEEIVDDNDANLLASIYKNSLNMNGEVQKTEEKTFQYISCVTRQVFLQTVFNFGIDSYIEEKNRWLTTYTSSFESILDDILTMHKQGDMNSMDCY